jgi:indolepyruvate ferredoxin oxidoreductase
MSLDALIDHRAQDLAAYQNAAYAERFQTRITRLRAAEAALGSEAVTREAAISLHRLMAYKDEYEVARLHSDGRFAAYRAETWKGGKAKVWLAPPLIARKGPDGKPRKLAFAPWVLTAAFPLLARLKSLRGSPLDPFGATAERRMERGLITAFEAEVDRLATELNEARLPLALGIAKAPQAIRGFGHVKEASVSPARAESARLWGEWTAA